MSSFRKVTQPARGRIWNSGPLPVNQGILSQSESWMKSRQVPVGGGELKLQLKFQWTETVPVPHDSLEPGEAPFPREVICLRCSSWEPARRLSQDLNVFWHLCRSWSSPRRLRGEAEPGPGGLPALGIARPICAYPAQACACRDLSPSLQAFLCRSLMISVLAIFMVLIPCSKQHREETGEPS